MAGIGFDLRKIFHSEKGIDKAKVSFQSLFVTSGPWIISIFTIATLKIINESLMIKGDFNTLVSVVIYSFIFSNIISSPLTNLVTRHISDLLYIEKTEKVLSAFLTGFMLTGIVSFGISYFFIYYFTNLTHLIFNISYLFTSLNILWFVMAFVSMLKEPQKISNAFLVGMLIVIILNFFISKGDLEVILNTFTIGVCFTIYFLTALLINEFQFNNRLEIKWLFNIKYYPLVLSGFFLSGGMWADKLIYWFSSNKSVELVKGFFFFPAYDFATFLAYLTIIPTTAFFVIFIETTFYETQRKYLSLLESNGSFYDIKEKEEMIIAEFYKSLLNVAYFQILIAILFIIIVPVILEHFNIVIESIPLIRITTIDASLQMIFNVLIIFLYYFDYQKETTFITLTFFIINFMLSYVLKDYPFEYTGYSYFISLVAANLIAFLTARFKLKNVTYYVLMDSAAKTAKAEKY